MTNWKADLTRQWHESAIGRWYLSREPQEQLILTCLAYAVGILLIWALLWKPISDWQATEDNRYRNAQNQLAWLQANESKAREAMGNKAPGAAGGRSLIPIITRSADALQLKLTRLQPESNGVVSVVVQNQPFNAVMRWLAALEDNNGVRVDRASIDAGDSSGRINAQIRLM